MTGGVVRLEGSEPFAIGGRRLCFVHPDDPSVCVKVNRTDRHLYWKRSAADRVKDFFRGGEYDNNADEARQLESLMRRLGPEKYAHFPRFLGWIKTDKGRGLTIDLVRDHDGAISRTLREAVVDGADLNGIKGAYDEFGAYLLEHRLVTRALLDHNMVAQDLGHGRWRIHLVDGFGATAALPLERLLPGMARPKIRARLDRCWRRVEGWSGGVGAAKQWDTSRWGQGFLLHRGRADDAQRSARP